MLGQGVGIIAKQLLATAVVMHHLIPEQELPWAGTPEFAGVTAEGCSLCSLTRITPLLFVLHAWSDSPAA